jgi:hypothetical protein
MSVVINGSAGVTTNSGAVYDGIQASSVRASTSGTAVLFSSIPSWVKRITLMYHNVSASGTDNMAVTLGTSGGLVNTGYGGNSTSLGTSGLSNGSLSTFINVRMQNNASSLTCGTVTFTLLGNNIWTFFGGVADAGTTGGCLVEGSISLGGTLTQLNVGLNGSNTFDGGSINILYE